MDVQLRTEVPVFSAVVTPQQFHETAAHVDFFRKHFATKGVEVAEACTNTLLSLERLRGQVAAGAAVGAGWVREAGGRAQGGEKPHRESRSDESPPHPDPLPASGAR